MGKGLRQGDPLSPLLYILVSEFLHLLIKKAEDIKIIKGIRFENGLTISHLQFAADTIFFLENEAQTIEGIKVVLIIFQMMTGLQVNFHKSCLYTSTTYKCLAIAWAKTLGCELGKFPFEYLGATIGGNPNRKKFWVLVTKKVSTKLASWRASTLSQTGRLVLIKSVLDAIPTYWFSVNKFPLEY